MPRGNHSHSPRGRGGPNRGGFNGRGRGRGRGGGFVPDAGRGRGRGGYIPMDEIEQPVQMWREDTPNDTPNKFYSPKGRGRGGSGYAGPRSGFSTPGHRGANTPRGRGRGLFPIYPALEEIPGLGRGNSRGSPRGRGRGRGGNGLSSKLRGGAPLSKVLYEDRPFLRPVKFVRSVITATLFTEEEEIFKPVQEAAGDNEARHVPTADRITHIFSGDAEAEEDGDGSGEEELEQIDFSEIGRLQAVVDAAAASRTETELHSTEVRETEEVFTGFYIDTNPAPISTGSSVAVDSMEGILGGEMDAEDEEVIVYIAPHPRAGPVTPPARELSAEPISNISMLTGLVHSSLTVTDLTTGPENGSPSLSTYATGSSVQLATLFADTRNVEPTPDTEAVSISETRAVGAATQFGASSSSGQPRFQTDYIEIVESPDPDVLPPPPAAFLSTSTNEVSTANDLGQPSELESAAIQASSASPWSNIAANVPAPSSSQEQEDDPFASMPAHEGDGASTIPAFSSISLSFADSPRKKQARRLHPVNSPRALLNKRHAGRRKSLRHFSSFGAMLSEAHLREEAGGKERDPRRLEQRRGDSDIDWGDDSDEAEAAADATVKVADIDEISEGVGGMDLDGDLDIKAMQGFVNSMSASGSRHVTMDDIADIEKMKQEDEESEDEVEADSHGDDGTSDSSESEEDAEVEAVVQTEERNLTGDGTAGHNVDDNEEGEEDEDEEESSDEDEEETPRRNFQARLERMRSKVKGKQKARVNQDGDSDFDMDLDISWRDADEAYLAHIQDMLDENEDLLSSGDCKQHKEVFRAIRDGALDYDEYEEMMGRPAKCMRDKNLPPELRAQWEKDREKKAENKRKRALARSEAAADPLGPKKGGKKGMKDMLKAARFDHSIEIPNRVVNMVSLEQQIRRFLANIGGSTTMALPPADKGTRKRIHELADAFSLKSQSKGSGKKRYTTLIKTTMSGININEKKVRRILKTDNGNWVGPERNGGTKASSLAKHREGEEVGKAAPKIGESNIGFKMLAAMGWSEGERIGLSGGLHAPLVAVMKKTKLGLGATL